MISWFNLFDMFVHVCRLRIFIAINNCFPKYHGTQHHDQYVMSYKDGHSLLITVFENPFNPTPIMCQKESSYPKPSKVQLILREALRWTVFRRADNENHHLWSWIITLSSFISCIVIIILMNTLMAWWSSIIFINNSTSSMKRVWNQVYHSYYHYQW